MTSSTAETEPSRPPDGVSSAGTIRLAAYRPAYLPADRWEAVHFVVLDIASLAAPLGALTAPRLASVVQFVDWYAQFGVPVSQALLCPERVEGFCAANYGQLAETIRADLRYIGYLLRPELCWRWTPAMELR